MCISFLGDRKIDHPSVLSEKCSLLNNNFFTEYPENLNVQTVHVHSFKLQCYWELKLVSAVRDCLRYHMPIINILCFNIAIVQVVRLL
jgi:hypothetical protein